MSEDTTNDKGGKRKLDLGLSSLLEGADLRDDVASLTEILKKSVENSEEEPLKSADEGEKQPAVSTPPEGDELAALAGEGKWSELAKVCESKLAASEEVDQEARLWWIKSQFALSAIPVSILSPSLDSISHLILKEGKAVSNEARRVCIELLKDFSVQLRKAGEADMADLFLSRIKENTQETEQSAEESQSEASAVSQIKEEANEAIDFSELGKIPEPRKREGLALNLKVVATALLCIAILLPAAIYYRTIARSITAFISSAPSDAEKMAPSLTYIINDKDPQFLLPEPVRVAGLNNLDAVLYDLTSEAASPEPAADTTPMEKPAKAASAKPAEPSLAVTKLPDRSAEELEQIGKTTKDGVNTNYPEERSVPRLPRNEEDEIYKIDFPPFRNKENRPSASSPRGPNYIIIARTRVMSEPSYWAPSNGDLQDGDRVLVEADLGKWLRIKAKNGEIGYILSQDANRLY